MMSSMSSSFGSRRGDAVWTDLHGDLQAKVGVATTTMDSGAASANADSDFRVIPVIDVAPLCEFMIEWDAQHGVDRGEEDHAALAPSPLPSALDACIRELHDACHRVGFFYVRGHGVDRALIDRAVDVSKRFFEQPLEKKMEISCIGTPNRGYFDIGGENLGEKKHGDIKEGVDMGRERMPGDAEHEPLLGPNKWPSDMPEFRTTMMTYHAAMWRLGRVLESGIALALNLPPRFFAPMMNRPMVSLRVLHYPPQDARTVSEEYLGAGPHTDYGFLTLLYQTSPGLQVRNRAREWIDCPLVPDTFVVNLGDMIPRWTNNHFVSTPHRVINTQPNNVHRYSLPCFYEPNLDAEIAPLAAFVTAQRPAAYQPVTFRQHLQRMYDHTYERPDNAVPDQSVVVQQAGASSS